MPQGFRQSPLAPQTGGGSGGATGTAGHSFAAGDDFKEQVRTATDLVGLVGEKVRLQSRSGGRDWIGLCPFHDDSKPSFHVYPERNTYRCWACQEGGDCFSFVMQTQRLEFREALELLARRAGLELPSYGGRKSNAPQRDKVLAACEWAAKQFAAAYGSDVGSAARGYIESRGFSEAIVERFAIGFHPDDWTWLIKKARGRQIPIATLDEAKLISKSQRTGDWLDYFVGRVLFPIRNERGQTVAFGGRVLPGEDDRGPKYFNTPETPYFSKSRVLFGLDVARETMEKPGTDAAGNKRTRRAVVVEGYTDCITLHQYGLTEAVGVLGTALTDHHSRLLARFADQVVLVFDGDAAGQNAAARSVGTMLASDLDVRVLVLPDKLDPDEYLKAHGADSLRQLLDTAVELWPWRVRRAVQTHGVDSVASRERAATELLDTIHNAGLKAGQMRTDSLLHALERPLQVGLAALSDQLRQREQKGATREAFKAQRVEEQAAHDASAPRSRTHEDAVRLMSHRATIDDKMEAELLQGVLGSAEDFAPEELPIDADDFTNIALGKLYRAADALARRMQEPDLDNLLTILTVPDLKRLLVFLDDRRRALEAAEREDEPAPAGGMLDTLAGAAVPAAHLTNRSTEESAIPPLLNRPLQRMLARREEQSHRRLSRELPGEGQGPMSESEDALRALAEYHARRSQASPSAAGPKRPGGPGGVFDPSGAGPT